MRAFVRSFGSEAIRERTRDVAGIVTVTCALLVYGVLQERIMTVGFGPNKSELFEHSIFLVLCNRLCTCVLAFAYIAASEPSIVPAAPWHSYASVSCSNVIATYMQYEALKYVSFAIQTLAKSAKALPVMVWGSLYTGKRYKTSDYLHASIITLGCTVFIVSGNVASRTVQDKSDTTYMIFGALLMVVYLAVDGLTSTWQDGMFRTYNMGICDQVLFTTMFSTALSFAAAVTSGQLVPPINFLLRHPEALWWIMALSMASAIVQLVISFTIKRFGAVVFASIMTTRQFFSVLLSCLVFLTPLTATQWLGVAIVFAALYYKIFQNARHSKGGKGSGAAAITSALPAQAVVERGPLAGVTAAVVAKLGTSDAHAHMHIKV